MLDTVEIRGFKRIQKTTRVIAILSCCYADRIKAYAVNIILNKKIENKTIYRHKNNKEIVPRVDRVEQ